MRGRSGLTVRGVLATKSYSTQKNFVKPPKMPQKAPHQPIKKTKHKKSVKIFFPPMADNF